jgi:hypothetical protein
LSYKRQRRIPPTQGIFQVTFQKFQKNKIGKEEAHIHCLFYFTIGALTTRPTHKGLTGCAREPWITFQVNAQFPFLVQNLIVAIGTMEHKSKASFPIALVPVLFGHSMGIPLEALLFLHFRGNVSGSELPNPMFMERQAVDR